jgi:hypothetical protein
MLGLLEFKSSMAQGVLDPDGDDTIFMSESKLRSQVHERKWRICQVRTGRLRQQNREEQAAIRQTGRRF